MDLYHIQTSFKLAEVEVSFHKSIQLFNLMQVTCHIEYLDADICMLPDHVDGYILAGRIWINLIILVPVINNTGIIQRIASGGI